MPVTKRDKFVRGDLVQYYACNPSKYFTEKLKKHETSIGIVRGYHGSMGEYVAVDWISHNFRMADQPWDTGWNPEVLRKVGHVEVDDE